MQALEEADHLPRGETQAHLVVKESTYVREFRHIYHIYRSWALHPSQFSTPNSTPDLAHRVHDQEQEQEQEVLLGRRPSFDETGQLAGKRATTEAGWT